MVAPVLSDWANSTGTLAALRQYNRRNDPIRRGQVRYDGIPQELDVLCATGEIGTMVFHKSELIGSF